MKHVYSVSTLFLLYWLACCTTHSSSFTVTAIPQKSSQLGESSSSSEGERPTNMVSIASLVEANTALKGYIESDDAKEKPMYVIGKIMVNLSIVGQPGLDLAEAPGLVLVSGVSGNALEVGVQKGDTIVNISVTPGGFSEETKGLNLDDTASILMSAANHAVDNGLTEVELELNRLVKIAYTD